MYPVYVLDIDDYRTAEVRDGVVARAVGKCPRFADSVGGCGHGQRSSIGAGHIDQVAIQNHDCPVAPSEVGLNLPSFSVP